MLEEKKEFTIWDSRGIVARFYDLELALFFVTKAVVYLCSDFEIRCDGKLVDIDFSTKDKIVYL